MALSPHIATHDHGTVALRGMRDAALVYNGKAFSLTDAPTRPLTTREPVTADAWLEIAGLSHEALATFGVDDVHRQADAAGCGGRSLMFAHPGTEHELLSRSPMGRPRRVRTTR